VSGVVDALGYAWMRPRIILIAATVAALSITAGCSGGPSSGGAVEVVASFYPLAYAAERVGGDGVSVRNLTPPGSEPHDFELSARDVEAVRSADLVLYLGSGFQPALEDAVAEAGDTAVDLLGGLPLLDGDPHVWLDPLLYAEIVKRVGVLLGRPEAAAEVGAELDALDAAFRQGLATCERRTIVTSHAAFGYLARRYGLEQVSATGISPEVEPTPRDLDRVVDEVRASGATTIFFETLVSPKLAQTIARETGAATAVLNPIEGLTGEEAEADKDYVSLMRENLAALREGLGCR
jgi:zinc transport system substrate-binding protein